MSQAAASATTTEWQTSTMAQEREFHKYFPLHPTGPNLSHKSRAQRETFQYNDPVAKTSPDTALTAFAQLGALRLNTRRALISLFDRDHQHVLAEATKTLSLQDNDIHSGGDELWLGCTMVPRDQTVCHHTVLSHRKDASQETQQPITNCALVIPDLSNDDRFKDASFVLGAPHARFYAGVPIVTPKGIAIGSYSVIDDIPREAIDETSLQFMRDMATTVMNYLFMARLREQNRRGDKMIAGLGRFVDENASHPFVGDRHRASVLPIIQPQAPSSGTDRLNFISEEPSNFETRFQGQAPESLQADTVIESTQPSRSMDDYQMDADPENYENSQESDEAYMPLYDSKPEPMNLSKNATFSTDLQGDMLSDGVKHTFQRAAEILHNTIEIEGTVFFDASIGSYGGLVGQAKGNQSQSDSASTQTSSSSDGEDHSNRPQSSYSTGANRSDTTEDPTCRILGFSISNATSDEESRREGTTFDMRENLLKNLLRRYPDGKIFNFDENGLVVSFSESSDGSSATSGRDATTSRSHESSRPEKQTGKKKNRFLMLKEEVEILMSIFSGARSVAFFPMWDSHRNRWFSASFAWTTNPMRIFTNEAELGYLYAFCNSIMIEVNRLDIKKDAQAKSNLVSSISHELRSPLHGVLGSSEILGDTAMDSLQYAMVHTIESCGRTLLDIINNLLDFAKINNFTRTTRPFNERRKYRSRNGLDAISDIEEAKTGRSARSGMIDLTSSLELDVILEEVLDAVFSGHSFYQMYDMRFHGLDTTQSNEGRRYIVTKTYNERDFASNNGFVAIIFNVDYIVDWAFRTEAGAWRRILMNLFGNSLKYTHSGFISVTLVSSPLSKRKASRYSQGTAAREEQARVSLVVKDTGQGIDKEFLRNNIFTPFSQENNLTPGSGLGLSIVYQTVLSLGGKIDVRSSRGIGTEISISVDLPRSSKPPTPNENEPSSSLSQVRRLTVGKSIQLLGFEPDSPTQEVAMALLSNSLEHLCKYCFGMTVDFAFPSEADSRGFDFYLVAQMSTKNLESLTRSVFGIHGQFAAPLVIVLCPTPDAAHQMATTTKHINSSAILEFISQPCGPRKLGKALYSSLQRQGRQVQQVDSIQPQPSDFKSVDHIRQLDEKTVDANATELPDEFGIDNAVKPREDNAADHLLPIFSQTQRLVDKKDVETEQPNVGNETVLPIAIPDADENEIPGTPVDHKEMNKQLGPAGIALEDDGFTALLVDDNPINLQLVVAFMKKANYSYVTASNGLEALEAFKSNPGRFHVVLTDISMPVMDGLEMAREMRRFERERAGRSDDLSASSLQPTPIMAISGLGSANVQQEAFSSGIDLFLSKPVRFKGLIEQVKTVLSRQVVAVTDEE